MAISLQVAASRHTAHLEASHLQIEALTAELVDTKRALETARFDRNAAITASESKWQARVAGLTAQLSAAECDRAASEAKSKKGEAEWHVALEKSARELKETREALLTCREALEEALDDAILFGQ